MGKPSRKLAALVVLSILLAGCSFRDEVGQPPSAKCYAAAPVCFPQRAETVPGEIGYAALGTFLYPVWLLRAGFMAQRADCHSRGGHWVCVNQDCSCITVD